MRVLRLVGIAGVGVGVASAAPLPAHADAVTALQPYQLVRSLEQVQDRIAGGDQAAMPMQKKLLEMVDARFRAMAPAEFAAPLNRRALLVYAMSGGNPASVDLALSRLDKDDPDRKLGVGILLYLQGQTQLAERELAAVDPMRYPPELGAYLALVKASVLSATQPKLALALLDQARLLSPGTLVEEAALRRSLALAATTKDPKRFMLACAQYVRGYIHSPYASQFADAFVAGVIALHQDLDLAALGGIAGLMDPEREKVIYLRIARGAAIEGLAELSAFASEAAERHSDDPRALLYSSLSSVTSDTVEEVLAGLGRIDRGKLSENDRRLLDAATAIAAETTAKPPPVTPMSPLSPPPRDDGEPVPAPLPASKGDEGDGDGSVALSPQAPAASDALPAAPASALPAAAVERSGPAPAGAAATPGPDATDLKLAETRRKLADIDELLGAAGE